MAKRSIKARINKMLKTAKNNEALAKATETLESSKAKLDKAKNKNFK